jgi:hypothetical protein
MSALRPCGVLGLVVSLAACSGERPPHSCNIPDLNYWAKSVTKAPGTYEGYSVSSVSGGLYVTVTGKGPKHFGERTECSSMKRWLTDGSVPTFADQDDRCNFLGGVYAALVAAGVELNPGTENASEAGFSLVEWADMDRAIEIAGAELRASEFGESLALGQFYQCR